MNILLINQYAGSLNYGMEYRPFYLAREWTKLGHNVTIAASSFSHVRTLSPSFSSNYSQELIDGIRYLWLKTSPYSGNGVRRAMNIFGFVLQLYRFQKNIVSGFKPDLVISSSTHPLDIFPAYSITRKENAKLIFEVHDLWPLSPIELGGMSPNHPYIRLLQYAENFAYRKADRVVSMLPNAEGHMREHGLAEGKFVYIPNGIDVNEWSQCATPLPEEHAQTIQKLKKQNRFLVAYTGAHNLSNALDYLIYAASLLDDQSVTILMIGQGSEKNKLRYLTEKLRLNNVVFLPPVLKTSIPELLNSMDALYLGWRNEPLYRFGISPNKLLDYMMAAKPIVHACSAENDMVKVSGCGISVPPEDPEAIAEAIRCLMHVAPSDRESMGLKGREYVMQRHDYRILAQDFLNQL